MKQPSASEPYNTDWRKGFLAERRHGLRKFRRAETGGSYISAFPSWLSKF